jgi:hypothetical protein
MKGARGGRKTLLYGTYAVRKFPPLPSSKAKEERKTVRIPAALDARERNGIPGGTGRREKKKEILAKIGGLQAR